MSGLPSYRPPPEAQLLGALCRPSAMPGTADIQGFCERVANWPYFLQLTEHHRVAPLAARGAAVLGAPLPANVSLVLRERSAANAREAFFYLAELQRLLALLAAAGIRATVLKGVPLSSISYGDVGLREVGDIDLLIAPADAERSDMVLQQSGLTRKEPAARLTPKRLEIYARYFKDYTYDPGPGDSNRRFEVDLHWRLVRDSAAAQAILPHVPNGSIGSCQALQIGSMEIDVLTFERSLLYLAVHGAVEGWARCKTLVDIAALWTLANDTERASAWDLAAAAALTPYLRAALVLAEDWFGPLPGASDVSTESSLCRYILGYTRSRMIECNFMPSPAGESTFAMKWHEARLFPSLQSRFELAGRVLFRPRMWESLDLPDSMFFVYPVLSPVEWLLHRSKHFTASRVNR